MSTLENTLKQLRLSGLVQTLDVRLQEAVANRLGHAEFLELICQDELNVRQQRQMERRTKAADFRGLKTLEDFDWSFNPAIHRKEIFDLATGNFIRQAKDVLFLGPPGVGKTHLAQAIGYEAIKMNFQVLYRSIFDLVRDFMKDEAFNQHDKTLRRYRAAITPPAFQRAERIGKRHQSATSDRARCDFPCLASVNMACCKLTLSRFID